jgi:hypothetical protein
MAGLRIDYAGRGRERAIDHRLRCGAGRCRRTGFGVRAVANMTDGARGQEIAHEVTDVVSIGRARDETEGRRTPRTIEIRSPLQPLMQVVRLVGERAHIGNPHIEQVLGIGCGISYAATDGVARLNQYNVRLTLAEAPRDMNRRQCACRAAPDNCNAHRMRRSRRGRRRSAAALVLRPNRWGLQGGPRDWQ